MHPTRLPLRSQTVSVGVLFLGVMLLVLTGQVEAGDWPQILGPQRNGQASLETPLAETWTAAGPKLLWRLPAGSGYAGAAIAKGQVFVADREQENERLTALD